MSVHRFLKINLVVAALVSMPAVADAVDITAPLIPVYNWTGLYIGGHIGAGWTAGGDASGFLGGGQAGFNYQIAQWVVGVEGQFSASNIKDTVSVNVGVPGFAFGLVSAEARINWISTLAVRAGWTFDHWLIYGKVGGAWAHVKVDTVASINPFLGGAIFPGGVVAAASSERTVSGWMLGVGAEYVLWTNWTAKVEYNMMDFGNDFVTDRNLHVIKAGLNYRL
jgi:outer membrane immunogenic protein